MESCEEYSHSHGSEICMPWIISATKYNSSVGMAAKLNLGAVDGVCCVAFSSVCILVVLSACLKIAAAYQKEKLWSLFWHIGTVFHT